MAEKACTSKEGRRHQTEPLRETTDEHVQLVFRAANGDREAYAKVYTLYYPVVINYMRSLNGHYNQHDLEDMVQDTFHDAFRKIKLFNGESTVKTWLFGFAIIVCYGLNRQKNRGSKGPRHHINWLANIVPTPTEPHKVVEEREQIESLQKAISRLSLSQQKIVNLRYHSGLSHKQVSNIMKCSEKAAKCRLSRIVRNLEKFLRRGM